jgi:hypothetical protein
MAGQYLMPHEYHLALHFWWGRYTSYRNGETLALLRSLQMLLVCSSSLSCFVKDVLAQCGGVCVFTLGGREVLEWRQTQINNVYLKCMSHLKKMDLHHNVWWRALVLHIGHGIATNSIHDNLFELFPPCLTIPQLKLPTHTISRVKICSKSSFHLVAALLLQLPTSTWDQIVSMREKMTSKKGIMLGRMMPGNFLGTGSSGCAARQGVAKDVPAAGRWGVTVVVTATVAVGGAMERLAAPVDEPRSETGRPASGAGGSGAADEGRSATGVATTAALAARLSAGAAWQASKDWAWLMNMLTDGVIMTNNNSKGNGLCEKWHILIPTKKTKDASWMQKFRYASYLRPSKGFGM